MVAFWKKGQRRIGPEPKRKPPVVCESDWGALRSIAPGRDGHTMFGVPSEWTNAHCVPVCSVNFFTEMFGWSDSVLYVPRDDNNDSVAPSHGVTFLRGDPARGTFLVSSQILQCDRIDIDEWKLLP